MAGPERNVSIVIRARNEAGKALGSLVSSLTTIGGITAAAGAAVAGLGLVISKLTAAAVEQEKADVRLATALASIGQNTEAVRGHLGQFISRMQDVTTVSDETISGVVATFAQLGRLSGRSLEQATKAALDYAAATGQDVQTAAVQMVNVLVKGSGRLQGIATDFDSATSKGDRFASVIGQIEKKMGDAAAMAGGTFSAALQRIANDYDDLQQQVGAAIVQNETFRGLLSSISDFLKDLTAIFERNKAALDALVESLADVLLAFVDWAAALTKLMAHADRLDDFGNRMLEWVGLLREGTTDAGVSIRQDLITALESLGTALERLRNRQRPLSELIPAHDRAAVTGLAAALEKAFPPAAQAASDAATGTKRAVQGMSMACSEARDQLDQFHKTLDELNVTSMQEFRDRAHDLEDALNNLIDLDLQGLITPEEYDLVLAALMQMVPLWEKAGKAVTVIDREAQQLQANVAGALTDSVFQFGDALIDTAFGAKIAWGQFFRQMLADLLKTILRIMLMDKLFRAIGLALGGSGGAAAGGAAAGAISIGGGVLAEAAAIMPARVVEPGVASVSRSAGTAFAGESMAGSLVMPVTIVPRRDRTSEAIEMLDEINTLVERRGYRLVASQVTP